MTSIADIKKDPKFPNVIKYSDLFYSDFEIKKIFPSLGLENFSVPYKIKAQDELKPIIIFLLIDINNYISNQIRYMRNNLYNGLAIEILQQFNSQFTVGKTKFIVKNKNTGKITLNLHKDIVCKSKVVFKKGEALFRVWNKINLMLSEDNMKILTSIETSSYFKEFNALNIAAADPRIVFSSTGMDGAWDIATMSERGITSCQSWHSDHATHLAGSVADPYTAIMYLTNGSDFKERGPRMIRRCIVRIGVDEETLSPVILLEKMYPAYNKSISIKFISLLKKKLNKPIKIIDCSAKPKTLANSSIVLIEPKIFNSIEANERPYVDSKVKYKELKNIGQIDKEKLRIRASAIVDDIVCALIDKLQKPATKQNINHTDFVSNYLYWFGSFLKKEIFANVSWSSNINQCILQTLQKANTAEKICEYVKLTSNTVKYNCCYSERSPLLKTIEKEFKANVGKCLNAEIKKLQKKTPATTKQKPNLEAMRKIFEPYEKI
jgi:hypothetical protein